MSKLYAFTAIDCKGRIRTAQFESGYTGCDAARAFVRSIGGGTMSSINCTRIDTNVNPELDPKRLLSHQLFVSVSVLGKSRDHTSYYLASTKTNWSDSVSTDKKWLNC